MQNGRNYIQIADHLVDVIRKGVLKPGDKLPPQREFAYEERIAPSTASRVYAELVRRGVAVGEVGRGTFIRAFNNLVPELGEPVVEPINMQLNFSVLDGQADDMVHGFHHLLRKDVLENSMKPIGARGEHLGRQTAASLLKFGNWMPDPDNILFSGGGRQGIAASFTTVASPGERIAIESMTYPVVRGIAARMGINLVPIDMDNEGIRVDQLEKEHKKAGLKAVYIQPTLHNPLGITMSDRRKRELADYIAQNEIYVIEDVVYAFLKKGIPFGRILPEQTITVESLSKRLSPGLNFGFVVCPEQLREKYITSLRTGGWITSGISYSTCQRWMSDGTVQKYEKRRRRQAKERQELALKILENFEIETDPFSYHLWMKLPDNVRAENFCAEAASRGVAISPAGIFAVTPGSAPNAVRIALAPPSDDELVFGLETIRDLAISKMAI